MIELLYDPAVWFWGICWILLQIYYKSSPVLTLSVAAFATGLWEVPFFLARPSGLDIYFIMLLYHCVPLMIYMLYKKVNINIVGNIYLIMVWILIAKYSYALFILKPTLWAEVATWYTIPYYLTYIPRIITMFVVAQIFKPSDPKNASS